MQPASSLPKIRKDSAGQILKTIRADFDSAGVAIPDLENSQANGGAVRGCGRGNHQRRRAGEKVIRRGLKLSLSLAEECFKMNRSWLTLLVLQRDLGRKSATFWDHAFAGRKIKKIRGPKLNTIAIIRWPQIPAPYFAAAGRKSICPNRPSYQNVSRETLLSDPGPESVQKEAGGRDRD